MPNTMPPGTPTSQNTGGIRSLSIDRLVSLVVALLFALGILVFVAVITTAAISRYAVDDALKVWGGLGSLVGLITGAAGTYFFTQKSTETATQRANAATQEAQVNNQALTTAVGALTPEQWATIRHDRAIVEAIGSSPSNPLPPGSRR